MAGKQYESSERVSWSCTAVDRSVSTEGLVFVLGHSKGDIWWLQLLGGPLPNQPSVEAALEKLSYSVPGRDHVPQHATSIYHQHRTPAITGRTNPPPAVPENEREKALYTNRVEKSFWSPFLFFFSKRSVKQGAAIHHKTSRARKVLQSWVSKFTTLLSS